MTHETSRQRAASKTSNMSESRQTTKRSIRFTIDFFTKTFIRQAVPRVHTNEADRHEWQPADIYFCAKFASVSTIVSFFFANAMRVSKKKKPPGGSTQQSARAPARLPAGSDEK